jgi:DNA-binding CsgD family transcriptional regulator
LDPALDKVLKDALKHWPKPRSESVILGSSDKQLDLTALKWDHQLPTVYVLTILQPPETPLNAAQILYAAGLTELQASVALLIYEGMSQISAADRLAKSVNTVKSHLQGIYLKVGVRSERELTRWVGELLARESG